MTNWNNNVTNLIDDKNELINLKLYLLPIWNHITSSNHILKILVTISILVTKYIGRYCCIEVHSNTVIKSKDIMYSRIKKRNDCTESSIHFSLSTEVN